MANYVASFVGFVAQSCIIFLGHFYFMVNSSLFGISLYVMSHSIIFYFKILIRPTSANKSFPYHIKTNQIGPSDNFPHHIEDQGGNLNFNDVPNGMSGLTNIFLVQNQQKYRLSDDLQTVKY